MKKWGSVDWQADVGSWPPLTVQEAPLDSEKDGMPDDWETAKKKLARKTMETGKFTV